MVEGVANFVKGGVVADCGHFIADERPEYLVLQINEFLRKVADTMGAFKT